MWDFLFTYYSLRPRQLRTWHPGFGVVLAGESAQRYLGRTGYGRGPAGVAVTRDYLAARADTVRFIAGLLRATASRPARLNCFGLHEWAMVYRAPTVRHDQVPLRLGAAGTDAVVESMPLRCSHFDAYRFFTEPASARNSRAADPRKPGRRGTTGLPACLHGLLQVRVQTRPAGGLRAGDGLPGAGGRARELDMRASPYDLRDYGFEPIAIETPAGRAEYVRVQQHVAEQAAPLRDSLADRCELLLTAVNRETAEAVNRETAEAVNREPAIAVRGE